MTNPRKAIRAALNSTNEKIVNTTEVRKIRRNVIVMAVPRAATTSRKATVVDIVISLAWDTSLVLSALSSTFCTFRLPALLPIREQPVGRRRAEGETDAIWRNRVKALEVFGHVGYIGYIGELTTP